jgi:hypothetical protein
MSLIKADLLEGAGNIGRDYDQCSSCDVELGRSPVIAVGRSYWGHTVYDQTFAEALGVHIGRDYDQYVAVMVKYTL